MYDARQRAGKAGGLRESARKQDYGSFNLRYKVSISVHTGHKVAAESQAYGEQGCPADADWGKLHISLSFGCSI